MAGRYFDEWALGDKVTHGISRTVTETDNLMFSLMTHNSQLVHIDAEVARASEFGQILVNSCFTFSLMVGISIAETTQGTVVANLGFDKVSTPNPVFLGDTLTGTSEVIALRESKSRPDVGIVTFKHEMTNQRGEVVLRMERTAMVRRAPVGT
ncbi:MAG: MaoC family dehydratase [Novosphingobium sp.]